MSREILFFGKGAGEGRRGLRKMPKKSEGILLTYGAFAYIIESGVKYFR